MSTDSAAPKPEDLSYCGVDCKSCDVFKATVHGDREARMRAARLWAKTARQHWRMEELDPMILDCRGCRAPGPKHKGYGRCPVTPCAQKRNLVSCAFCGEWQHCEILNDIFANNPEAPGNLRQIAASAHQGSDPER